MTSEWPQRRPRHAVRLTAQIMRDDESCLEADVTNLSLEGCGIAGWYVGQRGSERRAGARISKLSATYFF